MLRGVTGRTEPQLPRKLLSSCMLVVALMAATTLGSAAFAQPLPRDGDGEQGGTVESLLPPDFGPVVVAPPARFAGWFQPWVVGLLVGLPLAAALAERRRDIARWLRRRQWGRRGGADG
jgi:hypothetical protein